MKILTAMWPSIILATFVQGQTPNVITPCERLSSLALANTTITSTHEVPAGKLADVGVYPAPPDSPVGRRISKLPAFCRVAATLTPTPDSDIKIEVWLPASGWNGKFQAVGNGGWAGSISYSGLAAALQEGMRPRPPIPGIRRKRDRSRLGHPEKLIDFAYRAVHEMTVKAKAIVDGVLRPRAAALVLEWLLDRRAAGSDGGAALSGRLRWDRRRRSGEQSDSLVRVADRGGSAGSSSSRRWLSRRPNSLLSTEPCSRPATRSTESRTAF